MRNEIRSRMNPFPAEESQASEATRIHREEVDTGKSWEQDTDLPIGFDDAVGYLRRNTRPLAAYISNILRQKQVTGSSGCVKKDTPTVTQSAESADWFELVPTATGPRAQPTHLCPYSTRKTVPPLSTQKILFASNSDLSQVSRFSTNCSCLTNLRNYMCNQPSPIPCRRMIADWANLPKLCLEES
jgi:hypothetical protein